MAARLKYSARFPAYIDMDEYGEEGPVLRLSSIENKAKALGCGANVEATYDHEANVVIVRCSSTPTKTSHRILTAYIEGIMEFA